MITVSYIAGIVLGRLWLGEPDQAGWLGGFLLLTAAGALMKRLLSAFMAVLFLLALSAGAAVYLFASTPQAGGLLNYQGYAVNLEGTVVEEPLFYEERTVYRLRAEALETREARFTVEGHLLLKVYGAQQEFYRFGERLRLRGVIVEPRGRRNPGDFDYRFHLLSQGIDAVIYLRPYQVNSLGRGEAGLLSSGAVSLRLALIAGIEDHLPGLPAGLLAAILFGQRHRLPAEVEESFRRAGVGHLMAVSGLHVGLVAALILGFWRRLRLRGALPLLLAIILVFGYAYLTGMRPAALRASIMLSLALGALLLDRERDLPTAVALAALVTLIYNPLLLWTVGFQLSYAATMAIIYLTPPLQALFTRLRLPASLRSLTAVTLAAQLGVLPLSAYHFQHIPLGALFFNFLLLPVMPLVMGLGLAGALVNLLMPVLALPFFWACRPLLEYLLFVAGLADLPGAYRAVFPPGVLSLFLFYAGSALLLLIYYRRRRAAGPDSRSLHLEAASSLRRKMPLRRAFLPAVILLSVALLLVWGSIFLAGPGRLTITFIDVGQGAAALVEAPCGLRLLIDGGGGLPFHDDPAGVGERILLPFLRHRGIRSLDLVIVSHPHEDHFGGLLPLIEALPVGAMWISPQPGESPFYLELLEKAAERGIPVEKVWAGQTWRCPEGLLLEIIGPPPVLYRGTGCDLNNNSIILRLTYRQATFLFCGDIEEEAARDLLDREADLAADLLLVPHHGAYLPALPQILEAVDPLVAVIPVGTNPFGHPHPFTLRSLEEAGVPLLRNDLHGAVTVDSCGATFSITTMLAPPETVTSR